MWFWLVPKLGVDLRVVGIYVDTARVVAGANLLATVRLSEAAPPGGTEVTISGTGGALSAPKTVLVPAGEREAQFTIKARAVDEETTVKLEARLGDSVRRRNVTVMPAR